VFYRLAKSARFGERAVAEKADYRRIEPNRGWVPTGFPVPDVSDTGPEDVGDPVLPESKLQPASEYMVADMVDPLRISWNRPLGG
jgi:hypothetical protein